ncbi:hypothetical protein LNP25_14215 [Klebsiella variicola subsp. variicola]|nr:hypothetical protein [Klebsiella variicola subsp. variicola]
MIALSDRGEQLFRHRLPTPREGLPANHRDYRHPGSDGRAGDRTAGYRGDGIPGAISPYTGVVKNASSDLAQRPAL